MLRFSSLVGVAHTAGLVATQDTAVLLCVLSGEVPQPRVWVINVFGAIAAEAVHRLIFK